MSSDSFGSFFFFLEFFHFPSINMGLERSWKVKKGLILQRSKTWVGDRERKKRQPFSLLSPNLMVVNVLVVGRGIDVEESMIRNHGVLWILLTA